MDGCENLPFSTVRKQHVDKQHCSEIKWRTGDLTFCEWRTHYWHVQGRCSQARDNGAVLVYWPSRQRAAHRWTSPSVFWQLVDNCLRCGGMCIFPIYGLARRIQLLDTYQKDKQRPVCYRPARAGFRHTQHAEMTAKYKRMSLQNRKKYISGKHWN